MKRAINILLLAFYSIGTFLLPMGDFSMLNDIPAMYRHCKATEDQDMTPVDFITDHLINVDCFFDKHDQGDEQKPHSASQFHHPQPQNFFITQAFKVTESTIACVQVDPPFYNQINYFSNFRSSVFRPPVI